jgi:hypothetical protein
MLTTTTGSPAVSVCQVRLGERRRVGGLAVGQIGGRRVRHLRQRLAGAYRLPGADQHPLDDQGPGRGQRAAGHRVRLHEPVGGDDVLQPFALHRRDGDGRGDGGFGLVGVGDALARPAEQQ